MLYFLLYDLITDKKMSKLDTFVASTGAIGAQEKPSN